MCNPHGPSTWDFVRKASLHAPAWLILRSWAPMKAAGDINSTSNARHDQVRPWRASHHEDIHAAYRPLSLFLWLLMGEVPPATKCAVINEYLGSILTTTRLGSSLLCLNLAYKALLTQASAIFFLTLPRQEATMAFLSPFRIIHVTVRRFVYFESLPVVFL